MINLIKSPQKPISFPLGQVVQTANASRTLNPIIVAHAMSRHRNNDWGDLSPDDRAANNRAVKDGGERIFSAYSKYPNCPKFWIITEGDRSSTCVLLPADY